MRMAHYLSASAVSAKNLAEEKDAIKTLIGDISHQTKTPIANLPVSYTHLLCSRTSPQVRNPMPPRTISPITVKFTSGSPA